MKSHFICTKCGGKGGKATFCHKGWECEGQN